MRNTTNPLCLAPSYHRTGYKGTAPLWFLAGDASDWSLHLALCAAWESGISLADVAMALKVLPGGTWRVVDGGTSAARYVSDRTPTPGVLISSALYTSDFDLMGELKGISEVTDVTAEARRERAAQDADERAVERENEREAEAMSEIASRVDDAVLLEMEQDAWRGRRGRAIRASENERKGADHWGGDWAVGGDLTEVIDTTEWNPTSKYVVQWAKGSDAPISGVWGMMNAAGARKWDHMADEHLKEMAAIERAEARPVGERDYARGTYLWRQSHTRYHRTAKVLAWVADPGTPTPKLLNARGYYLKRRKESQAVDALGMSALPQGPWPGVEGRPGVGLVRKYQARLTGPGYGMGVTVMVTRFPDWSGCFLTSDQADRIESAIRAEIERRSEAHTANRKALSALQMEQDAAWRTSLGTVGRLKSAIG
jgi:hypothetical protein